MTVRIPAELKRKLQLRARKERRSLSSEIATALERSVGEGPVGGGAGRLLGLYEGTTVPADDDFAEVRAILWGSLRRRSARHGP